MSAVGVTVGVVLLASVAATFVVLGAWERWSR